MSSEKIKLLVRLKGIFVSEVVHYITIGKLFQGNYQSSKNKIKKPPDCSGFKTLTFYGMKLHI